MERQFRLLHLGRVQAQPQRPAAYTLSASRRDSPFECLPAELIFQVAAWLPPSSITLLSLCNHKLHEMLSQRSLRELAQTTDHKERAVVLEALDRDLPETLYCFTCRKLHVLARRHEDRVDPEELHRRVSESRCLKRCLKLTGDNEYSYRRDKTYHTGFPFEHFQMAMKLYRRGNLDDAKAFLMCSAILQPARRRLTSLSSYEWLYIFEPRLVNGQVSVRAQSWIFIPGGQGLTLPLSFNYYTTVCAHQIGEPPPYLKVSRCQLKHLAAKQASCDACRSVTRCHYCATELNFEAKWVQGDSKGGFLVVTKWQLLGPNFSPTDAYWKSHLGFPTIRWQDYPLCAPRDIRASYEEQPGIKYDSLIEPAEAWNVLNSRS